MPPCNGKSIPRSSHASDERTKDVAFGSILRTLGLLDRVMQPYFARFGITASQWAVLRTLNRAEGDGLAGLRLTDLSERLIIRPPSVTGVVDRLERLALVVRENLAGDLRAKQVRLTSKGRQLMERVLSGHAAQIDAVLGGLTHQDHEQFQRLLAKLNCHLESMADGVQLSVHS